MNVRDRARGAAAGPIDGLWFILATRTLADAVGFQHRRIHRRWCVDEDHDSLRTQYDCTPFLFVGWVPSGLSAPPCNVA